MEEDDIWLNVVRRLVSFTSDGASVMTGKNNGVAVRLSRERERLFGGKVTGIHCMAHRLELAYHDAIEELSVRRVIWTKYFSSANLKKQFEFPTSFSAIITSTAKSSWILLTKWAQERMPLITYKKRGGCNRSFSAYKTCFAITKQCDSISFITRVTQA